jgi:hypothetical protein
LPNRIIRESCRTSVSLAQLSHGAERMWWRLLTCADDFGRFQADITLLHAACFPRQLLTIHQADVRAWLEELIKQDMVRLYQHSGSEYGYFINWDKHNKKRAKYPKYPDPGQHMLTSADIREHMSASAHLIEKREARDEIRESRSEKREGSPTIAHATGSNGATTPDDLAAHEAKKRRALDLLRFAAPNAAKLLEQAEQAEHAE